MKIEKRSKTVKEIENINKIWCIKNKYRINYF